MSIPVPLGVRIYSHVQAIDVWVTRWVEDLQFRSVIPGGFASATFTLRFAQNSYPAAAAWPGRLTRSPLVRLFNRVQIVDQRTGEIAWEGRIESAARAGDDGWALDIGCAGAMVAATDITRPVFYADSSLEHWQDYSTYSGVVYDYERNDSGPALQVNLKPGAVWVVGSGGFTSHVHFLCYATNQYLARVSITYIGNVPSGTGGTSMASAMGIFTPPTTVQASVDQTLLNAAQVRKNNPVGAGSSFSSTTAQGVELSIINTGGSAFTVASSNAGSAIFLNPVVIPQRMDRNGTLQTTAASYPNDYVLVADVVEDVLGRFLNGGWTFSIGGPLNNPAPGSVGAVNAFIDTSDTTQITDLRFPDGATAADVLNTLMTVQTDAYWAIWESSNVATNSVDAQRYRFEWATWPNGWGYQASSTDGIDEQPDASQIYNFVYYQYDNFDSHYVTALVTLNEEWWDFTDPPESPLLQNNLTRAATVKKDGVTPGASATANATAFIANNGAETNAGTITVKRPIALYDAGSGSYSGAGRMLDPWMIRPGKLIRSTDLPPPAQMNDHGHGTTAPPATHTGTVFRVIATNYDAGDNSCRLELDQVTLWSLPGQIVPKAKSNVQSIPG